MKGSAPSWRYSFWTALSNGKETMTRMKMSKLVLPAMGMGAAAAAVGVMMMKPKKKAKLQAAANKAMKSMGEAVEGFTQAMKM